MRAERGEPVSTERGTRKTNASERVGRSKEREEDARKGDITLEMRGGEEAEHRLHSQSHAPLLAARRGYVLLRAEEGICAVAFAGSPTLAVDVPPTAVRFLPSAPTLPSIFLSISFSPCLSSRD